MADAAPPAAAPAPAAPALNPPRLARLAQLARELGTPGAGKLYTAARRRGSRVSKDEVKKFVATKGQKQLFRALPASRGRTGAETPQMRWQMDLIDMRNSPSEVMHYIFVLVNVYTRKVYLSAIRNKNPDHVAIALESFLTH